MHAEHVLRVEGRIGRRTTLALVAGGIGRTAIACLPEGELPREPLALILDLHGSGSTPRDQLARSGLGDLAVEHDFLVVAPQAGRRSGSGYAWAVPYTGGPGGPEGPGDPRDAVPAPDDEAFLLELVDALVARRWVDPARVCAVGMSGGGRMVSQLACDHPERLTAIAAVAGLRAGPPDERDPSRPARGPGAPRGPVPVIAFHGTADTVNPYYGRGQPHWSYSVPAALSRWAEANDCDHDGKEADVSENVRTIAYAGRGTPGEGSAADAVLYVVDGGGHTWPGSGLASRPAEGVLTQEISASEIILDFFLPRTTATPG